MSLQGGRDYLLLVWKDPKTKRRYIVGELSKNGQFEFSYDMSSTKRLMLALRC